jgi:hypothetical protein
LNNKRLKSGNRFVSPSQRPLTEGTDEEFQQFVIDFTAQKKPRAKVLILNIFLPFAMAPCSITGCLRRSTVNEFIFSRYPFSLADTYRGEEKCHLFYNLQVNKPYHRALWGVEEAEKMLIKLHE